VSESVHRPQQLVCETVCERGPCTWQTGSAFDINTALYKRCERVTCIDMSSGGGSEKVLGKSITQSLVANSVEEPEPEVRVAPAPATDDDADDDDVACVDAPDTATAAADGADEEEDGGDEDDCGGASAVTWSRDEDSDGGNDDDDDDDGGGGGDEKEGDADEECNVVGGCNDSEEGRPEDCMGALRGAL
jgi:hypothetical protein